MDGSGNIYVADESNHRIRKVTPAGVVTTLAGSGTGSFADGTGAAAQFRNPTGVAVDGSGNVYVADWGNNRIRKITSAGVVSTLAGSGATNFADGPGAVAAFRAPSGVAVDGSGNVYVADNFNHRIRKITSAGVVSTLAGNGTGSFADGTGTAARLSGPDGVAMDASGNLYIADGDNSSIRIISRYRIDPALPAGLFFDARTGTITGTPTEAMAARTYTIYAQNSLGAVTAQIILSVVAPPTATTQAATVVTATSATLNGTVNANGGTTSAMTIKYSTVQATVDAGNGTSATVTPTSVTGNTNTPISAAITGLTAGTTYYFRVSATNSAGTTNGSTLSFTTAPPAPVITYPGATSPLSLSLSTVMTPLTITNSGGDIEPAQVSTIAGSNIGFRDGTGTDARFSSPRSVAMDVNGNVYVADSYNHLIRKISPLGVVTTLAGSPGSKGYVDGTGSSARFNSPTGIALDASGNVFVAESNNQVIRKITPDGIVTTLAGSPGNRGFQNGTGSGARFNMPSGIAIENSGNIYVADYANSSIRKVTSEGVVTTLAGAGYYGFRDDTGTSALFYWPTDVALDGVGNLYVADNSNQRIRKIVVSTGVVTTLAGNGSSGKDNGSGLNASFQSPISIDADAIGNIYVADLNNHLIRKISTGGVVSTLAGSIAGYEDGMGTSAKFSNPVGVVLDGSGNLIVAEFIGNRIRKISRFSISPALPAGLNFNAASGEITGTPTTLAASQTYTVTAANAGGTSTTTFTLEVSSTLLTTAATAITETTATAGGTVDATAYAGATQKGVCWNTTGTPTIIDSKTTEGSGTGTFTSSLTSLTPNTTYFIRSYVTVGGTTSYGAQQSFKTNELGTFSNVNKTFGDAKFSLTAPSALSTGAFSYGSSNLGVATVSGSEVTIVGVGTTTITATQAAASAYASVSKTMTLTVAKRTPSITLSIPITTALNQVTGANTITVSGTSSDGQVVTMNIVTGGATGNLSDIGAAGGEYTLSNVSSTGTITFEGSVPGDANNNAATKQAAMDVTKSNQSITFGSLTAVTYTAGMSQTLTATGGASGEPVVFSVLSGPGSTSGTNGTILSITGPGSIMIKASQAGNGTYNAAPDVTQTLTVNPAAPVVSSFTPTSATEGDVVTITGQYFENVTAVSFGNTAASSFTVVNSTTITAILATGHTGDVKVVTTGGNHSKAGFRYKVVWTGATSAFTSTGNWSGGRVPQSQDDIVFSPTAASDLELNDGKLVGNIDFNGSGRSIKLNGFTLSVRGDITMPGNITGSGRIVMSGTTPQTITGGGTIPDLLINNSTGVTISSSGGELKITEFLRPGLGTLTTNGKLRLVSNSSGTARVTNVGGSVSGNVIAERYIPQNSNSGGTGRAWRLVSIPVSGTGDLRDFFMNGRAGQDLTLSASRDAETDNSGTPIVGHNYADASSATAAGFDWIGVANQVSSLRSYAADAGGGTFLSENVPSLSTTYTAADQGYMVFTRGDRTLDFPSTTSSGSTTFRSTGALKTGTQNVSISPASTSKYTLVGNPYMSVLDLDAFYSTNSSVINPSFWIWDANMSGAQKQGGYVNVYLSGGAWVTNTGSYINPQLLESGMAFFVEPKSTLSTATNISIEESHKWADQNAGMSPFSTAKPDDHGRMYVRLERADEKGRRQIIDGVMADFHTSFKEALTDMSDREKLRNGISRGALWIPREGKILSGEGLPWPKDVKRSIPLSMSGVGDQTLLVHINPTGMRDRYVKAWLKDNVLKREIEINMSQPTDYDFIGTGRSDWDSTRFEIVYVEAGRPGTGMTLEPDEVAEKPSVKLYPNPSKTAEVKLSLRAMTPGVYSVQLLDMTGRLVATSTLEHRSVNGEYRVLQGRLLSPGQYIVRLIDADKQLKETLRMMVE